jgi:hypothetical protein
MARLKRPFEEIDGNKEREDARPPKKSETASAPGGDVSLTPRVGVTAVKQEDGNKGNEHARSAKTSESTTAPTVEGIIIFRWALRFHRFAALSIVDATLEFISRKNMLLSSVMTMIRKERGRSLSQKVSNCICICP